jgi:hypothetical protein
MPGSGEAVDIAANVPAGTLEHFLYELHACGSASDLPALTCKIALVFHVEHSQRVYTSKSDEVFPREH